MLTAKRPALRRLWMIDQLLRTQKYCTIRDLAERAEVDTKTIYRDLNSLRDDHGAPLDYCPKRRSWFYTIATYRLPAVVITEGELMAMFLAGQALQQTQGTPYATDLQQAILKLSQFLPDEISLHWQALDQVQSFHQTVTTLHDIDIFRQLADAVLHHRQLRIRYWTASRDAETERTINPYHLACIDGAWYLLGYCYERQATRTFAPGRIRDLQETGETFSVPADFQIGQFFDGTFKVVSENNLPVQTVRLKFAPSAAKYIRERIWHLSQQLETQADDSVILQLSLRSMIEVRRWILSWGSECEVLAPAELRADILHEAAAMLRIATKIPKRDPTVSSLDGIQKREKRRKAGKQKRIG